VITLRRLQPSGIVKDPDVGFPTLIDNILIRTFMEPRVKEAIGWIGVAYRTGRAREWTFRVRGKAGVYSLAYRGHRQDVHRFSHGFFTLRYFPATDERILDRFGIRENLLRLSPDFDRWVRSVTGGTDPLAEAFLTGDVILSSDGKERNLVLSLQAPVRWREIRPDGLYIPREDGSPEAVPPGGIDRDLPAFALGWPFFDRLVLTLGYQLRRAPRFVFLKKRHWPVWTIDGRNRGVPSDDSATREIILSVGYGPRGWTSADGPSEQGIRGFFPSTVPGYATGIPDVHWSVTPETPRPRRGNPLWWKVRSWRDDRALSGFRHLGIAFRPPLLILTGFLGSGKTTLLNQIVEHLVLGRGKFIAVIQNEVGEVDVDSRLVDGAFEVTSLDEGCVCCTLLGELRQAIRRIATEYEPDLIILETTGVADPKGILAELPDLEPLVRFDTLVCVVDAPNLRQTLERYDVARSQIEWAYVVVVNKTDLVDDATLEKVLETVRGMNPRAIVIPATHARLNPALLFPVEGEQELPELPPGRISSPLSDLRSVRIDTFTLKRPGRLNKKAFLRFLETLPDSVYRMKGVVGIAGEKKLQLLQYVARRFELFDFTGKGLEPNTLVFIGRNLDERGLREGFERCVVL